MDKLDAMHMFVRVIEKGSFSSVAKERGIGQPAVSKQISALEDELGTELIHRTSRSIALTEAGRDFYESALHILDDVENATSRIGRGQTAPKGLIRVTVPPTFARLHMVSKLPAFFAAYPDMARRSLRTISTAFGRSSLSSEVRYNLGALALDKT